MKLNKKGFTLIELLAVIAITSLVLGLSSYGIISAYNKSKEKALVLNEKSILEAARVYSTEASSDEWRELDGKQYFCTTIQRLKNVGLLKKEAKSDEYEDFSLITVERNSSTLNVVDTNFINDDNEEIIELCDIKFFTIHFEYNVSDEDGNVPNDQKGEVCNDSICVGIYISSIKPKREGYRFIGWNTESDGSGFTYKVGDTFSSYSEDTITLYAQWEEDTYTIKYDGNSDNVEGNTVDTSCTRGKNCTLSENGFSKNGYNFAGWNTKSDATGKKYKDKDIVKNLTSSEEITLYAIWKSKYKVFVKFNVGNNGVIQNSTTSNAGVNYLWQQDSNGIISRSIDNGKTYSENFFNVPYNSEIKLPKYNDNKYMNITNTNANYAVSLGSVWKCISGECNGKTYNQTDEYNSNSFCDASSSNCTVILIVNWENKNLLSPIITPGDGISSENWHNSDYTLSITSENTGSVSYEYRIDNGNYQTYSNVISPSEGISTYTARAKKSGSYSGEVSYVSKLDKTPPSAPIITNPSNEEWVNYNFKLVLRSTDNLSGINHYEYRYENTDWVIYENSATEVFITTFFKKERNELVYVRACDNAGNCSSESSTYIRIDKTKPDLTFIMKHGDDIVDSTSNEYSLIQSSTPKWINYNPTVEWTSSDSGSGIKERYISENESGLNTLSTSLSVTNTISNTEPYSTTISSEGYRYIKFKVCDNASNCTESNLYLRLDFTNPTFTFSLKKNSENGENISSNSNEYSLVQSDNLKWVNYTPYFEWTTSDSLSGINTSKKNNFSYNKSGMSTLSTSISGTLNLSGNNDGIFIAPINSDGYRYIKMKICDNANNCVNSEVYIKLDFTPPSVSFQMLNGNSVVGLSYYSNSASSSLKWFTFVPTLRWTTNDSFSDVNSEGKYYYNTSKLENINETLSANGTNVTGTINENDYIFNVENISGGYRKYKFKICDNSGNCTEDTKYFKYYANSIVNRYVNAFGGINCRSLPSVSSSTVSTGFNCGANLTNLVKSYTDNWYYNINSECYVSGDYLSTSRPNCSSGGGGTAVGQCGACSSSSQCTDHMREGRCYNGQCQYRSGSGTWDMCN